MRLPALILPALLLAAPLAAEVAPEQTGAVERLEQPPHPHWVWVSDLVLRRSGLMDADAGRFLGMVNGGYGAVMPIVPRTRAEIYVPATYYARGTHGERTDVVEIYDGATLGLTGEVVVPPKRATSAVAIGHAALSDDDRFLALFNWTTGTSISIVDMVERRFAGEIETPGCSLVYAAGPRRFLSLCADGALFSVTLDDRGREAARQRSEPFFDPRADPVTEKAVRLGNPWLFVSFDGVIHPVDGSGAAPVFGPTWPLVDGTDRTQGWRVGGGQHLAVHRASGRLYALMHRGGPDTHKDPGEEVWIFDVAARSRVARVPLRHPGLSVFGFPVSGMGGALGGAIDWLLDRFAPPLVGFIAVTQDERPLLVTASQFSGGVGVYDASSGGFLRHIGPTGWTSDVLVAPWGGR